MQSNVRALALNQLREVRRGKKSSLAVDQILELRPELSAQDRALVTELIYGVLRWQGKIDAIIARFSKQNLEKTDPFILDILRLGVYQLLFLSKIPAYAAIDESVSLVKNSHEKQASGFVNAILREVQRNRQSFDYRGGDGANKNLNSAEDIEFETAHPRWLVQKWLTEYGETTTWDICHSNNTIAPLTLRANGICCSRDNLLELIRSEIPDIEAEMTSYAPSGIRLFYRGAVRSLPYFHSGYFQVQDEASQLVGPALGVKSGESVLDVCAAPGGKSTHLAELMGDQGEVFALDKNERRLSHLRENTQRLGLSSIQSHCEDFFKFQTEKQFDRILMDAPCSSLGSLRRCPEAKWHRTEAQIHEVSKLQIEMLKKGFSHLKPKGTLVYSVCTFTPEETDDVVQAVCDSNPACRLESLKHHLPKACGAFIQSNGTFKSLPSAHGMDGFFIARFTH